MGSVDIVVRPVQQEDAAAVVAMLNAIIEAGGYSAMDQPLTAAGLLEWIAVVAGHGVFNVAECGGGVVGMQCVEPFSPFSTAQLHVGEVSTFVALGRQRRGIGRRLGQVTFAAARDVGFLKLMATIRADNPQALDFYRAMGFEVIGTARRHALVHGKYLDEILAERWIG